MGRGRTGQREQSPRRVTTSRRPIVGRSGGRALKSPLSTFKRLDLLTSYLEGIVKGFRERAQRTERACLARCASRQPGDRQGPHPSLGPFNFAWTCYTHQGAITGLLGPRSAELEASQRPEGPAKTPSLPSLEIWSLSRQLGTAQDHRRPRDRRLVQWGTTAMPALRPAPPAARPPSPVARSRPSLPRSRRSPSSLPSPRPRLRCSHRTAPPAPRPLRPSRTSRGAATMQTAWRTLRAPRPRSRPHLQRARTRARAQRRVRAVTTARASRGTR